MSLSLNLRLTILCLRNFKGDSHLLRLSLKHVSNVTTNGMIEDKINNRPVSLLGRDGKNKIIAGAVPLALVLLAIKSRPGKNIPCKNWWPEPPRENASPTSSTRTNLPSN